MSAEEVREASAGTSSDEKKAGKKPKRKKTVWSRRTVFGRHARPMLATLFRDGADTWEQLAYRLELKEGAVHRQLKHLREADLVGVVLDMEGRETGRPRSVYHLTPSGVIAGARACGIENRGLARDCFGRVDVPSAASHRALGNGHLIGVRAAAGKEGSGVSTPEPDWSESWPGFPLFGSGWPAGEGTFSKETWVRVAPDGTFVLAWEDQAGPGERRFLQEVENGDLRLSEVADKVLRYASVWRRVLAPRNPAEARWHDPAAELWPVVIVTREPGHARALQRGLRRRLKDAPGWDEAKAAFRGAASGKADPGELVLLAGVEEALKSPLGRVYQPLRQFDQLTEEPDSGGGWRVGLLDAAEVASRVKPTETKAQVKARLKAEAEAAKEEAL